MPSKLIFYYIKAPEFFLDERLVDLPDLGEVIGLPGKDLFMTVKNAIRLAGEFYF